MHIFPTKLQINITHYLSKYARWNPGTASRCSWKLPLQQAVTCEDTFTAKNIFVIKYICQNLYDKKCMKPFVYNKLKVSLLFGVHKTRVLIFENPSKINTYLTKINCLLWGLHSGLHAVKNLSFFSYIFKSL